MFNRQCQLSEDDISNNNAYQYEKYLKIQDGINHTVPETEAEPKQETTPYIIGYCTDCHDPIYSNKGSLTLTRKDQKPQLFCNHGCANNYHNLD